MSEAPFKRGDLVEFEKDGGLGLVLGPVEGTPSHMKVNWLLPPKRSEWLYRDWHPTFDYQTGGYGLRKIGEIKL